MVVNVTYYKYSNNFSIYFERLNYQIKDNIDFDMDSDADRIMEMV